MVPIEKVSLPTDYGRFDMYAFDSGMGYAPHLVMVRPETLMTGEVLLRIHSECITGEVFGSKKCDCGSQLEDAMERISSEKKGGILIYLRQEGRGIGILNKMKAYRLQEEKHRDTVQANLDLGFESDPRDYKIAIEILQYFKVSQVALMTNNPLKLEAVNRSGIGCRRLAINIPSNEFNKEYLDTKHRDMGHFN